jgi:uroporphyrinogen-III synthase
MRVIVTRPANQADAWVQGLRAAGLTAVSWPLIDIRPTRDAQALNAARAQAADQQALMFVSANAVHGFFEENRALAGVNAAELAIKSIVNTGAARCWATGPGTVQALLAAGVPAQRIDAPGAGDELESEALWAVVQKQVGAGMRVMLVRGADAAGQLAGRPWLAQQLAARGAQVTEAAAYERHAPQWSAAQREQAQAALCDGSVWLWSSSEALHNLPDLPAMAQHAARAVATHPRIAQAARERGFAQVLEARPDLPALVRSIQSFA